MTGKRVFIQGYGAFSALGCAPQQVWNGLLAGKHSFHIEEVLGEETFLAKLHPDCEAALESIAAENKFYRKLDRSTLCAMAASQLAVEKAQWQADCNSVPLVTGVSIGSARGATRIWEEAHMRFLGNPKNLSAYTSPTTTLGNVASWVAQAAGATGIALSHSMTCSSAAHAIANGLAWIRAGFTDRFLAGGSEAPLTSFTVSQMRALRLCTQANSNEEFPCRPLGKLDSNTLVLGEGAAVFALSGESANGETAPGLGIEIESIGLAQEQITNATSISSDGQGFKDAMLKALAGTGGSIDVIVAHAPGTLQGDRAECDAIEQVFGQQRVPFITSNKWCIGHTFGASAALSMELAVLILLKQEVVTLPYSTRFASQNEPKNIQRIMINSAGFGGNAVSLVLRRAVF